MSSGSSSAGDVISDVTVKAVTDCVLSLNQAVQAAGGQPLTLRDLESISLLGFMKIAAANSIRFVYTGAKPA